jgi:hypothetical protein
MLRALATLATVLVTIVPRVALADDLGTAKQLFAEGKTLMASGKVAEACPKLEQAAALSQTPGVRLNLADCWLKLGRTASAWAMYHEARVLAERAGNDAAADEAKKASAAIEPTLSKMTLNVSEDVAAAGIELTRDGEPVVRAEWGKAVAVDPGEHEIAARAPGRKPWSTKRAVATRGALVTIDVPALAQEGEPVPAQAQEGHALGTQRVVALVAGAVGIVGVGIGSYFALHAISQKGDYQAHVGSDGQCLDATCQSVSHDAAASASVATVGFIAGAALLATGAVLWLTAPPAARPTAARVVPAVGPAGAGLLVRGGF